MHKTYLIREQPDDPKSMLERMKAGPNSCHRMSTIQSFRTPELQNSGFHFPVPFHPFFLFSSHSPFFSLSILPVLFTSPRFLSPLHFPVWFLFSTSSSFLSPPPSLLPPPFTSPWRIFSFVSHFGSGPGRPRATLSAHGVPGRREKRGEKRKERKLERRRNGKDWS